MWPALENPCQTERYIADRQNEDSSVQGSDKSFSYRDTQQQQANRNLCESQRRKSLR